MLLLGSIAGISSGLVGRGWDDSALDYVIPLTLTGAVIGLLLSIGFAAFRRHGIGGAALAFLTPVMAALIGAGIGASAAPDTDMTPDLNGAAWAAFGGIIGFVSGVLLVIGASLVVRRQTRGAP